jgi:hypothetical protein
MNILYDIAENFISKTWFFQNFTTNLNEESGANVIK